MRRAATRQAPAKTVTTNCLASRCTGGLDYRSGSFNCCFYGDSNFPDLVQGTMHRVPITASGLISRLSGGRGRRVVFWAIYGRGLITRRPVARG